MLTCPLCSRSLTRADYFLIRDSDSVTVFCTLCRGRFSPAHLYENQSSAKRFDPITIWVNNENPDIVSVPGRSDEPVEAGYHAVEITTIQEADRWAKHLTDIETRKVESYRQMEKEYWDDVHRQRRSDIRARIGDNPRAKALFEAVQKYVDAKREKRYSRRLDARGHFHVFAFDASNRQGYADAATGWKERKG